MGLCNGQLAELYFPFSKSDDDKIPLHLYFHYQESAEDPSHIFGHFSVLSFAPSVAAADGVDVLVLPEYVTCINKFVLQTV